MSSIEAQLARDIAAVTGGTVVTESDLREARDAVRQRIETTARRHRVRIVVLGAAAAVAVAALGSTALLALRDDDEPASVAGPGAGEPDPAAEHLIGGPPTVPLIAGMWRLDNGTTMVRFDADGTVRFDHRGTIFDDAAVTGTYTVDGDRITVTTADDSDPACIGTQLVMRSSVPEPGSLRYVGSNTESVCSPLPLGPGVLEQVLPTGPGMAELHFSTDEGWAPLVDTSDLHGVWFAEGGGHVLEMDPDGSFYVADDTATPVDVGVWSVRGAELTLTSSGASTTCSAGQQLVVGAVELIDPGTPVFRGTVTQNACGGAWQPAAWVLIPHSGS